VPVAGKLTFAVTSPPANITQGQTSVITVEYTNLGSVTAYKAQARLSAVEPFSSSDQTAYLGDIPPGGKATAQYAISASSSAAPGSYTLDTEVRYRDALTTARSPIPSGHRLTVVPRPAVRYSHPDGDRRGGNHRYYRCCCVLSHCRQEETVRNMMTIFVSVKQVGAGEQR